MGGAEEFSWGARCGALVVGGCGGMRFCRVEVCAFTCRSYALLPCGGMRSCAMGLCLGGVSLVRTVLFGCAGERLSPGPRQTVWGVAGVQSIYHERSPQSP